MNKLTMMDYINEQPTVCQHIIQNRKQLLTEFINTVNNSTQWTFLATGSSMNAINSVKYYIERICDIKINIYDPSIFVYYMNHWDKDSVFFAISQSGKSASTLKSIDKLQANGIDNVFLLTTNNAIEDFSKKIIIDCGEEKVGFVTKGFTATVLTLLLMSLEYAISTQKISEKQYDLEIKKLINHVALIDQIIGNAHSWYKQNKQAIIEATRYIIIAYGDYIGIANEAETKITETVRYPTSSYELEEYMHGPYLELNSSHCIFFLESGNPLLERSKLLKKYLQNQGALCYSISLEKSNQNNFVLPSNGFDFPLCSISTTLRR